MWEEDPIWLVTMSFTVIFLTGVLYKSIRGVYKFVKKEREIDRLEADYDRLRSARSDLKQHYYWAKENKETSKMKACGDDLFKVDEQLLKMREKFDFVTTKKYR